VSALLADYLGVATWFVIAGILILLIDIACLLSKDIKNIE